MRKGDLGASVLLGIALAAGVSAGQISAAPGRGGERFGAVNFPVSCSEEAQKHFTRAVALYYSFEWPQSRRAFSSALQADPNCAMAFWGLATLAMDNPDGLPLTGGPLKGGRKLVKKAKAAGPKTEREAAYIAAVETFFKDADTVPRGARMSRYEQAMAALAERYPEDVEATVLYAAALSANVDPADKNYTKQLKAARILAPLFARHPDHPGVAHYLIRSYDYPPLAPLGLEAANRYAQIAPPTPHALHLPSRIFTRIGYWRDSIAANAASAAAADPGRRLHAWDYMMYAYLQLGRDAEARRLLNDVRAAKDFHGVNFGMAHAFAAMPARYALERGFFAEAAALPLHPSETEFPWQRFPHAEAVLVFARGLGAARSGDVAGARAELERLAALRSAMLEAKQPYWADQAEIQRKAVEAWTAFAEKRNDEALRFLREAADHEDGTDKNVVSPGPVAAAREMLGELLLELGQPAQALTEFEAAMAKEPRRFRGLYGAGRAAERAGEHDKARRYYLQLIGMCEHACDARPELASARTYVSIR